MAHQPLPANVERYPAKHCGGVGGEGRICGAHPAWACVSLGGNRVRYRHVAAGGVQCTAALAGKDVKMKLGPQLPSAPGRLSHRFFKFLVNLFWICCVLVAAESSG